MNKDNKTTLPKPELLKPEAPKFDLEITCFNFLKEGDVRALVDVRVGSYCTVHGFTVHEPFKEPPFVMAPALYTLHNGLPGKYKFLSFIDKDFEANIHELILSRYRKERAGLRTKTIVPVFENPDNGGKSSMH